MSQSGQVSLQVETRLISAWGLSDPGKKRKDNEDAIFIDDQGKFMLVADGMGGQSNGARASAMAITSLNQLLMPEIIEQKLADITVSGGWPPEISSLCSVVETAVLEANQMIYRTNCLEHETKNNFMGTTLAGVFIAPFGYVITFHIGDSRIYRLHNEKLTLMTRDHSLYQEWLDNGQIAKQPKKNILTRAIGFDEYVKPDTHFSKYAKNDLYLICSDGLTNMLPERRIEAILTRHCNSSGCADVLVKEANANGGADNISVVVCRIKQS
jgi:protein phosphatase